MLCSSGGMCAVRCQSRPRSVDCTILSQENQLLTHDPLDPAVSTYSITHGLIPSRSSRLAVHRSSSEHDPRMPQICRGKCLENPSSVRIRRRQHGFAAGFLPGSHVAASSPSALKGTNRKRSLGNYGLSQLPVGRNLSKR